MQIPKKSIPAIVVLLAIVAMAISPMSTAFAQESDETGDSSQHSQDEKSYDEKDGKSCGDKNKDRSDSTKTSAVKDQV